MKAKVKEADLPPDVCDAIDTGLREATRLAQKARRLEIRREGMTAGLAQRIRELREIYDERVAKVRAKRGDVLRDVAALWDKHLPGHKSARFPVGLTTRQEYVEVEVKKKREVIDALDRLDRLDLVDQVIDTRGLRRLYREGKLDDLPSGAIRVTTTERFVVRHISKAECARKLVCASSCPLDAQSGSGKDPKDAV